MTGDKLGSMGPPVTVDTGIGAKQPSTLGKLVGQKPTPGIVIYVCCQDGAAKVKSDPGAYLARVIAERGGYSGDRLAGGRVRREEPDSAVGTLPAVPRANPAATANGGLTATPSITAVGPQKAC